MKTLLSCDEEIESLEIGDYKIIQNSKLYRFTSDAVILSRFAEAKSGIKACDLCSGSGIVGLHFFALNDKLVSSVTLVEMQTPLAEMSEKSIKLNGIEAHFNVLNIPIQQISASEYGKYKLVLCNPPYKKAESGEVNAASPLAVCRHEITVCFDEIAFAAARLLAHGGRFCFCHKTERLAEIIATLDKYKLSPTRLTMVQAKEKTAPYLFLMEAAKGVKPQLNVTAPIVNEQGSFSGENQRRN